jgi:hypothetical protein
MFFHSNQLWLLNKPRTVFHDTLIAYKAEGKFLGISFTNNWKYFSIIFGFEEGNL